MTSELLKYKPERLWSGEPMPGCWYTDEEINAAIEAMTTFKNWNIDYSTKYLERFEDDFKTYIGTQYALAINGAGTGFDMILRTMELKSTDEIISSAINFPGTHLAVIGSGAKLVLCEADETLNLSPDKLGEKITANTRAIIVTHMNGLSADMSGIKGVLEKLNREDIKIIGDAARSCGSGYEGEKVGKNEWATVFSFQTKKQMSTLGEGGLIVTDDETLYEKLFRYRSFGCGEAWGTNYKMTRVQAAVGIVQLKRLDGMNNKRIHLARERTKRLGEYLPDFKYPVDSEKYFNTYYLYSLLVPEYWTCKDRDMLIRVLGEEYNIGAVVANKPTYEYNKLIKQVTLNQKMPDSDRIGERIICPVLHPLMSEEENCYLIEAFCKATNKIKRRV